MRRFMRTVGLLVAAPLTFFAGSASASAATVAAWHMNEKSGTIMRDSAGSNDGTLHSVALGQPGLKNTAYGFNGSSSFVDVPDSAALDPGSAKFSIQISVNFTVIPPQDYDLIRKGLSTTPGGDYKLEIAHSGQALCVVGDGSRTATLIAGPKLNTGTWHTIQCTRTAGAVKLVVDGVRVKTTKVTIGAISNDSALYIGAKPGSDFMDGRLDEARVKVG
jgi:concanavalin A-like lectin/glucanase superfamily protein